MDHMNGPGEDLKIVMDSRHDPIAMYKLAVMALRVNWDSPFNKKIAKSCLKMASREYPPAKALYLTVCLIEDDGNTGRYEESLKEMAETDCDAMLFYAMYLKKQGNPDSIEYFKAAAEHGNSISQVEYGEYLEQQGDPAATDFYKRASDQGEPLGVFHYGCSLLKGFGVARNATRGLAAIIAVAPHLPIAMYTAGKVYEEWGNIEIALMYFKQAAKHGNFEAQYKYGRYLLKHSKVPEELELANHYIQNAADNGVKPAECYLILKELEKNPNIHITRAYEEEDKAHKKNKFQDYMEKLPKSKDMEYIAHYLAGIDFKKEGNYEAAANHLEYAADKGYMKAQLECAIFHQEMGFFSMAQKYYKMAVAHDFPGAWCAYGCFLYTGEQGTMDRISAAEYFKRAWDMFNVGKYQPMVLNGSYNYGVCLYHGTGTASSDVQKAIHIFDRAAHFGFGDAHNALGICYRKGIGVTVDLTKASVHFRAGAEIGCGQAAHNYAVCLATGDGVEMNATEAEKYFRLSNQLGYRNVEVRRVCSIRNYDHLYDDIIRINDVLLASQTERLAKSPQRITFSVTQTH